MKSYSKKSNGKLVLSWGKRSIWECIQLTTQTDKLRTENSARLAAETWSFKQSSPNSKPLLHTLRFRNSGNLTSSSPTKLGFFSKRFQNFIKRWTKVQRVNKKRLLVKSSGSEFDRLLISISPWTPFSAKWKAYLKRRTCRAKALVKWCSGLASVGSKEIYTRDLYRSAGISSIWM